MSSLHEDRWNEAKRRAADNAFNKAKESLGISLESKIDYSSTNEKDIKIKPLVYYNAQDCLNNAIKDFEEQAKKNIGLIKAARAAKGQTLTEPKDLKNVIGEFGEGTTKYVSNAFEPLSMHSYVRVWCGTVCIFNISESKIGFGSTKRNAYMIDKIYCVYYGKNHIQMLKEIVLSCAVFMKRRRAEFNKR